MLDDSPGAVYDDRRIDMLFFKKINAGLSLKLIFSGLAALTLFSTFSSCHIYNLSLEDFLKEWTETARVAESRISPEPVYKDSYAHIASGEDTLITYKLVNPQNYDLKETFSWETENSPASGTDYYFEQDFNDKNILYLTLKKDFLERLDGTGAKISPSLTLTEPKSKRTFGTYSVPALVNSAPPEVILPVVLRTNGAGGDETYVICFNLPEMTGIHQDVKTLEISSPYKKTYTVNTADGTLSGGGTELTKIYGDTWKPVKEDGAGFKGDKNNRFVGIVTDVLLSDNLTTFTLTLTDSSGLSTSVTASTQASELPSVTASPKGGTIKTDGTVTFTSHVSGAGIVLTSDNWDGVEEDGTPVPGKIEGIGTITLTFTKPGTYNITAYAQMDGAADSDKVIFTYKVVDDSTVYVSEFGDNNNPGTEDKPVATLQKALELLNDAGFTEGKIVVTGTVQTREVKINAPGDSTTGSVTTLTVRGGSAGGTLKNEKGRVFNITGGSVTLGDGITLTGTVTGENARGGAVYVTGGNFTMESGSTIADSSVQGTSASGGGVYVMNGTFIMEDGSKITGSSATVSGGGVAVSTGGIFTMRGGTIDGTGANSNAESGGGVEIYDAIFTMEGGTITGNNATYGGGVRVDSGEFTMKDGTISDNNATELGGGVCVIDGSFTMSDTATIQGNTATTHGGGVYVNGGNFEMIGGTIGGTDAGSANSAQYGGGVYVNGGEFEMTGTAILQGNTAAEHGGGVHILSGGIFTMNGGTIGGTAANTATYGGGVFVSGGTFDMNNGTISGNSASGIGASGGGVCISGGEFTMRGDAVISKNTADSSGGGVFVSDSGKFTMEGGTIGGPEAGTDNFAQYGGGVYVWDGTFTMNGGIISGNTATQKGGGVYVNSLTFTVTGTPSINNNTVSGSANNVHLISKMTITIGEDGLAGGEIGVTAEEMKSGTAVQITDKNVNNAASIFTSDEKGYRIEENVNVSSGGTAVFLSDTETSYSTGGNGGVSLGDFNDAFKAIESTGGDITVFKPVEITKPTTIFPSSGVTIDITASGATTVFEVQDGGSLTLGGGDGEVNVSGDPSASSPTADGEEISLINISNGGTVTIEENANIQNNQAGRGVTVTDGTLIMTGGSIKGNTGGYYYGSGVYVSGRDASFEMSGGEISNNTLELNTSDGRQGAGVMVCNGAKFTLSDSGKITDNSGYEGVGVTVSASTFTMNGGEISDNNGSGTSGGVYLISGSTMKMNGGKITRNKAARIFDGGGAGGVFIGSSCNFTGSTAPDTTASITENYVANTNVDVYFQSGGNGAYSPGNVQVGTPQNP